MFGRQTQPSGPVNVMQTELPPVSVEELRERQLAAQTRLAPAPRQEPADLRHRRNILAQRLGGLESLRKAFQAANRACEHARTIVDQRESALARFADLEDAIHAHHQAENERQVHSGEAPSLELPAALAKRASQRDTAAGALKAAQSYLDRLTGEEATARQAVGDYRADVEQAITWVLQGCVSQKAAAFDQAWSKMAGAWAEVIGALGVPVMQMQPNGFEMHLPISPPEDALRIKLHTAGLSGRPLDPQSLSRAMAATDQFTRLRDALWSNSEAAIETLDQRPAAA